MLKNRLKKYRFMFESLPGYHSHVVIYTVLSVGNGVSASSSLCMHCFGKRMDLKIRSRN